MKTEDNTPFELPLAVQEWLKAFSQKKDLRKVKSALKLPNKISVTKALNSVAASVLIYAEEIQIDIDPTLLKWSKQKNLINSLKCEVNETLNKVKISGILEEPLEIQLLHQVLKATANIEPISIAQSLPQKKGLAEVNDLNQIPNTVVIEMDQHFDLPSIDNILKMIFCADGQVAKVKINDHLSHRKVDELTLVLNQLKGVKSLTINSSNLHTLAPLNANQDLEELSLKSSNSPLFLDGISSLINLKVLKLNGDINGKEEIVNLKCLEDLSLENTEISFKELNSIPGKLKRFYLNCCRLPSEFSLNSFELIDELVLSEVNLDSLDFLLNQTKLKRLLIKGIQKITNLSELFGASELCELQISFMPDLRDLTAINNLQNLKNLRLTGLPLVKELPSFERLSSLKKVEIEMLNQILDFSQVASAPNLEEIRIAFAPEKTLINSFSVFTEKKSLKVLELTNCYREELKYEVEKLMSSSNLF